VTIKLQRRSHPTLARVMEAVSWPGFPPQSRLIPVVTIAMLLALRLRLEAVAMAGAWGTAILSTIVKALMRRPRPVAGVDVRVIAAPLGGSSFPSGHTITYVGVFGFLAYLVHTLLRPVVLRRLLVGALVSLVALVGPSRIHQGHHWFTDVTASYLLGASYLLALTRWYRGLKARGTREPA
jgi:undecaprenyl-diphosphatase